MEVCRGPLFWRQEIEISCLSVFKWMECFALHRSQITLLIYFVGRHPKQFQDSLHGGGERHPIRFLKFIYILKIRPHPPVCLPVVRAVKGEGDCVGHLEFQSLQVLVCQFASLFISQLEAVSKCGLDKEPITQEKLLPPRLFGSASSLQVYMILKSERPAGPLVSSRSHQRKAEEQAATFKPASHKKHLVVVASQSRT